jgi:hypothetical protein
MFTHWAFTSYEDFEPQYSESDMKYLVFGSEVCPSTGRHHWQSYVIFKRSQREAYLHKKFGRNIDPSPAMGSPESNAIYCKKDNNFMEYGQLTYRGQRTDIMEECHKHDSYSDFAMSRPDLVTQGVRAYYNAMGENYTITGTKPYVYWFYGPTGTGKTRKALDMAREFQSQGKRVYRHKPTDGFWFDGYGNQQVAILDEVRSESFRFDFLLQILDYDAPGVPIKGGFSNPFRPEVVIITSSMSPMDMYYERQTQDSINQLLRRIDQLVLFPIE